jgi:hypothetical protein
VQIVFVDIKGLATTTNLGPEGNLVKASSCGFVSHVLMHTKIINSATFANRSMSILEIMLISTVKNGFNVNNVISGFTVTAKSRMVLSI